MSRHLRRLKMDTCEVMLQLMDFVGSSRIFGKNAIFRIFIKY